jgi:hypothetical protein
VAALAARGGAVLLGSGATGEGVGALLRALARALQETGR